MDFIDCSSDVTHQFYLMEMKVLINYVELSFEILLLSWICWF